jgi:RNA polymerase sigma-70 factor (ECF subfamily)
LNLRKDYCDGLIDGSSNGTVDQETVWIRKIASGDRAAFEALFHAYKRRLLGYLYRMTGDATRAEELVSDVLVEVWKSAGRFQERSSVSTWIFGIAHHKAVDELRRRAGKGTAVEVPEDLADAAETPERTAILGDRNARLRAVLQQLTPEHREVLELAFFQGRLVEEIAGILSCPVNTVKTRMFYARKKLRELLVAAQLGEERR